MSPLLSKFGAINRFGELFVSAPIWMKGMLRELIQPKMFSAFSGELGPSKRLSGKKKKSIRAAQPSDELKLGSSKLIGLKSCATLIKASGMDSPPLNAFRIMSKKLMNREASCIHGAKASRIGSVRLPIV